MRSFLLIILFFITPFFYSQSVLTVYEEGSQKPLQGVLVKCNGKIIGSTNLQGKISFQSKCKNVDVSKKGYYSDEVLVDDAMEVSLGIADDKETQIEGVVIEDKSDPRALEILKKINENYKKNSPESLDSYSYKSYDKITLDLDEDTVAEYKAYIDNRIDSLKMVNPGVQEEKEKKDSLEAVNIMKMMKQSKFFLWERASEFLYSKKLGEKVNVLDNRVSGLKNPIYEMLTLRTNRNRVPREVREENRTLYRYFLTDTISIDGRENYVIRFRQLDPKQKLNSRTKFNGYLYVDTETYALKKLESNSKVKSEGSITSIWKPIDNKWFLEKENIRLKAGDIAFDEPEKKDENADENVDKTEKDKKNDDKKDKKPPKKFGNYVFLTSDYFDWKTNIPENPKDFKGYTLSVENSDGSLLDQYRTQPLSEREMSTYDNIDSLGQKFKLEQKASIFTALLRGKLRLGKVDVDLSRILTINKYEGLRLGTGLKLNERFHKYISPDIYFAYGFEDHNWKYGAGIDFKTTLKKHSFFRLEYYNDVAAAGNFNQAMWNFRMKIANNGIDLNNANFYKYVGFKAAYETDLGNDLTVRLAAKKDKEEGRFGYDFMNLGSEFDNFATIFSLKYSPNSKNVMAPSGKYTYDYRFPEVYFNYEQGLNSFGGDLNYSRFDVLFLHHIKTKLGNTIFRTYGGLTTGEAPIWHHFTMNGLSTVDKKLNFNFTSFLGFATMEAGKYYNDKFAGLYVGHKIPWYFKSIGKNVSSFDLVYRTAIGDMKNPEFHNFSFEKMNHLYQEVGLEYNNFLSTKFDLGFFFRIGHYRTDKFSENFAIQLKYIALEF